MQATPEVDWGGFGCLVAARALCKATRRRQCVKQLGIAARAFGWLFHMGLEFGVQGLQGYHVHKKTVTPSHHHRALGIGLP